MARPISLIEVTSEELAELRRRSRAATTTQRDSLRARIILARAEGSKEEDVAVKVGVSLNTVSLWSKRFREEGLAGLVDKAGRGRKPSLPADKVRKAITTVTQPPPGRPRWSTRSMGAALGISHQSVQTIWSQNDLKPHLTRTFKISNDPRFEDKFWDIIGLYLHPPDKALVLCCDEKSQCQALERTQPDLPLGIGHIRTKTHDYRRHGTLTLFAALNYLDGKLISRTELRHTHVEWLRFLKQIHRETPKNLTIHVIADNSATHKHQHVKDWLAKHTRFQMHFTPTSSSWMNLVEKFFGELTADCIRDGSFQSVGELADSIMEYLAARNRDPKRPKRYVWKAKGVAILQKIKMARIGLNSILST